MLAIFSIDVVRLATHKNHRIKAGSEDMENTPLRSRMQRRMNFTSGVFSSKTLSSTKFTTYYIKRLIRFSINLLAFYNQCCSLIGYPNHYLFGDR